MDKLVTQAIQFLNELNAVADQIRLKVDESNVYLATQQPKIESLKRVEEELKDKQQQLAEVQGSLDTLTAAYQALRDKLL
jgi:ABC-type transporter Mla subunit MlaD